MKTWTLSFALALFSNAAHSALLIDHFEFELYNDADGSYVQSGSGYFIVDDDLWSIEKVFFSTDTFAVETVNPIRPTWHHNDWGWVAVIFSTLDTITHGAALEVNVEIDSLEVAVKPGANPVHYLTYDINSTWRMSSGQDAWFVSIPTNFGKLPQPYNPVPEPSPLALLSFGLAGLTLRRRLS